MMKIGHQLTTYTTYLKLTNQCNLKCLHCYNYDEKIQSQCMSREVIFKILEDVKTKALSHPESLYEIKLHGGEPMLADTKLIVSILDFVEQVSNMYVTITSNLVYKLTDDRLSILKRIATRHPEKLIQTSWDFQIRFANNKQSALWEHNVHKLLQLHFDVQPTICITTKLIDAYTCQQLIDMMLTKFPLLSLNFERLTENGRLINNVHLKPLNRQVDRWLTDGFKYYHKNKKSLPYIAIFQQIYNSLNNIYNGCNNECCTKFCTTYDCQGNNIKCPNNSKPSGVINILTKSQYKRLQCLQCEYYSSCHGDSNMLNYDSSGCPGMYGAYHYLSSIGYTN